MQAMHRTTIAAQELASELFQRFRAHSQEAEQVALNLIEGGQARLTIQMTLAGIGVQMRLLLEPVDPDDGLPVEISSTSPIEPSAEGLAARMWFFGKLKHWNQQH